MELRADISLYQRVLASARAGFLAAIFMLLTFCIGSSLWGNPVLQSLQLLGATWLGDYALLPSEAHSSAVVGILLQLLLGCLLGGLFGLITHTPQNASISRIKFFME